MYFTRGKGSGSRRRGRVARVDVDRPEPEARSSTAARRRVPRLAATVIVLRGGGDESLEVLLVQRNPQARFMGGAWVFPGGAVAPEDGEGDAALRAAACASSRRRPGSGSPARAS